MAEGDDAVIGLYKEVLERNVPAAKNLLKDFAKDGGKIVLDINTNITGQYNPDTKVITLGDNAKVMGKPVTHEYLAGALLFELMRWKAT